MRTVLHDFRIVGESSQNLIFDLVVPFEYDEKRPENFQEVAGK